MSINTTTTRFAGFLCDVEAASIKELTVPLEEGVEKDAGEDALYPDLHQG